MDEEKQRKEEEALQNEANRIGRDKKKNKSKFQLVASGIAQIIATIVPILMKFALMFLGAFILGAIIDVLKLEGDNSTAGVASVKVIDENVDIAEAIDENGEEQGYYFKINKDIIKKYLEELNRAYHLRILGGF